MLICNFKVDIWILLKCCLNILRLMSIINYYTDSTLHYFDNVTMCSMFGLYHKLKTVHILYNKRKKVLWNEA